MKKKFLLISFLLIAQTLIAQTNTITGAKLNQTITFSNSDEFNKNAKIIERAAKNSFIIITIPYGSSLRKPEEFSKFLEKCLKKYKYDYYDSEQFYNNKRYISNYMNHLLDQSFLKDRLELSDFNETDIQFTLRNISTIYMNYWNCYVDGFLTPEEYTNLIAAQKSRNQSKGLGYITDMQCAKEMKYNDERGYGSFTNTQLDEQRYNNNKEGLGNFTNYELIIQMMKNDMDGYGPYTDVQLETQRANNEKEGFGYFTDMECYNQAKNNSEKGYGRYTDTQLDEQRNYYNSNGLGSFTYSEIKAQIEKNELDGYGSFTDMELEKQRDNNEKEGLGRLTDSEIEKQIEEEKAEQLRQCIEQNQKEISAILSKAENYRSNNEFCYTLGAYYDAMLIEKNSGYSGEGTQKYEEFKNYLINEIQKDYSAFKLHDQWKEILINAEKYGTEYGQYAFYVGQLKQTKLDYSSKTATYSAEISFKKSERYLNTIEVIQTAYEKSFKEDWTSDLPKPGNWPNDISVSGQEGTSNYINQVAIYRSDLFNYTDEEEATMMTMALYGVNISKYAPSKVYNAFAYNYAGGGHFSYTGFDYCWFDSTLYDLKFNIIDDKGNELVKPKRSLLINNLGAHSSLYGHGSRVPSNNSIEFTDIPENVIEMIENNQAKINLLGIYLQYGNYSPSDDTIGKTGNSRAFIKNMPEIAIDINKVEFLNTPPTLTDNDNLR